MYRGSLPRSAVRNDLCSTKPTLELLLRAILRRPLRDHTKRAQAIWEHRCHIEFHLKLKLKITEDSTPFYLHQSENPTTGVRHVNTTDEEIALSHHQRKSTSNGMHTTGHTDAATSTQQFATAISCNNTTAFATISSNNTTAFATAISSNNTTTFATSVSNNNTTTYRIRGCTPFPRLTATAGHVVYKETNPLPGFTCEIKLAVSPGSIVHLRVSACSHMEVEVKDFLNRKYYCLFKTRCEASMSVPDVFSLTNTIVVKVRPVTIDSINERTPIFSLYFSGAQQSARANLEIVELTQNAGE